MQKNINQNKKSAKRAPMVLSMLATSIAFATVAYAQNAPAPSTPTPATQPSSSDKKISMAGDLEIYAPSRAVLQAQADAAAAATQAGAQAKPAPALMMMLDTSASMTQYELEGGVQQKVCSNTEAGNNTGNRTTYELVHIYLRDKDNNIIKSFVDSNGKTVDISQGLTYNRDLCRQKPTRFAALKEAIVNLMSGPNRLEDHVQIGLARFPAPANIAGGAILLPTKPLTVEHRWNILQEIARMTPIGATPSASAYVEAGAYMLGTKTANVQNYHDELFPIGYVQIVGGNYQLYRCASIGNLNISDASISYTYSNNVTLDGKTYKVRECRSNLGTSGNGYQAINPPVDKTNNHSIDTPSRARNFSALDFNLMPDFNKVKLISAAPNLPIQYQSYTNSTMPKTPSLMMQIPFKGGFSSQAAQRADMYQTKRLADTDNKHSGFGISEMVTKVSDGSKYATPVTKNDGKQITINGQCGASVTIPAPPNGYGLYFLTDGVPNQSNSEYIGRMMKEATGKQIQVTEVFEKGGFDKPSVVNPERGPNVNSGWNAMAAFAKELRSKDNKVGEPIRTAALGLGDDFTSGATIKRINKVVDGKNVSVVDCDNSFSTPDARNLCRFSEKGYGYGEGGFLVTNSSADITNHIKQFVQDLEEVAPPPPPTISTEETDAVPSGALSVPLDPYDVAGGQLPVAYMPMLEARIGEKALTWPGNMRKFHLHDGTPVGRNKAPLFLDSTGKVNPDVIDFWSKDPAKKVQDGSFYARLAAPKANEVGSVRTVWVEDFDSVASKKYVLKKFGVNNQGQITLNGNPYGANNKFLDSATYTDENIDNLLGFLGFDKGAGWVDAGGATTTDYTKVRLKAPAEQLRVLGASPHSSPASIFLNASLQEDGTPSNNREDYVLFGSTDGALHLADASDLGATKTVSADTGVESPDGGKEVFAIIPRAMLTTTNPNGDKQASALLGPKAPESQKVSEPVFGVDAPWLITTSYSYDSANQSTVLAGAQATGGFRLGAEGLVSYNIKDINNPELAYSLNKDTQGFGRLGQIWVRPTKAKIQLAKTGDATDVLIFGGGYDMCYESDEYQAQVANPNASIKNMRGEDCTTAKDAVGNAVYMINAKTGELIWSATKSANATGKNSTSNDLTNSIVGEISVLDRNSDGLLDAIYFADLGGQVFRADFQNAGKKFDAFNALRMQTLYKDSQAGSKYARRFYEKPVVSVHRGEEDFNNSRLYTLVNVVSGDRSSPTSKLRSDSANADRVFGIFDLDVGAADEKFNTMKVREAAKDADLHSLDGLNGQDAKKAAIASVKKARGWYYSLTRFDGYSQVKYNKAVGRSEVISGFLYTSIYNPTMRYTEETNQCRPEIVGGTERQLYCLPYGVCKGESSKNGTGGFIRVGKGIQELVIGPVGSTDESRRSVTTIGTTPVSKIPDVSIGFGEGPKGGSPIVNAQGGTPTTTGGDGTLPPLVFDSRFAFKPVRWYDDAQFATQRRN